MSPHAVNTFVSDLVQMAQAMERLPQIEAELATVRRELGQAQDTIQRLELKLIDRNTTIDELNAKVRSAEVSRDDAELRFLEADERITQFGNLVKTAAAAVGLIIVEPKPAPTPQPIPSWATPEVDHTGDYIPEQEAPASAISDPTAFSEAGDGHSHETAPLTDVHGEAFVNGSETQTSTALSEPVPDPYSGRRYIDVPGYVRLEDWLAGGGTEESYYAGRADVAPSVA